ncbi:hypothetical protein RM863_11685 [Streptomyces sp. DSM 41014]|uniref:Minor tail protein n=1 Tax=Streptomyces hintoniae TaxID=3075521 RepID=A0ABU2UHP5_9ACTN|nr:hypothetical protein [Streptomyces sp. DSM 41014]MDT0472787.1 hypothetical protein [Streptomyces sp. DSM 41014]
MAVDTIPPVTVEVAFDGGPYDSSYTWTDITPWVSSYETTRGRNSESDRIEAGTLDLTLDNSDGRFTPQKDWSTELLPLNVQTGTDTLGTTSGFNSSLSISSGTSTPHGGARALQVSGASVTSGTAIIYTDRIPVKPGNRYRGSYWIRKTTTSGYASVPQVPVIRWRDAGGAFLADSIGSAWDGVGGTWRQVTVEGMAPEGAAYGVLICQTSGAASASLVYWSDDWSLAEVAPYAPNVVPRRRVRVRTANLLPKDTASGGDVSQSSLCFQVDHVSGQSKTYVSGISHTGPGSVRADFAASGDGTTPFSASVRAGYFATERWAAWTTPRFTYWRTRLVPRGLAQVVAGRTYTASGYYRMVTTSATDTLFARLRWYAGDGTLAGVSSSVTITPISGQWVFWQTTGVAASGATLAGVEIGTRGSVSGVAGMLDTLQVEEGSTVSAWTPGGSIFSGFVEKWPVRVNGLTSEIVLPVVDAFNVLGTTELQRPMRQHILSTAPWGYWPLTEGPGSTSAQNLSDETNPGPLKASKYGGGTAAFGAPSVVANDDGTSLSITNVSNTKGTVVDCTNTGVNYPELTTEFAASFWCLPTRPSAGVYSNLFRVTGDDGQKAAEVVLDSDGYLTINVGFPDNTGNPGGGWHWSTSEIQLSSSTPSLVTISIAAGEGTLYINDRWATSTADQNGPAVAPRLRPPKYITLGGNISPVGPYDFTSGRFGHLAIWDRALTTEFKETYYIGAGGYGSTKGTFFEDEAARLSRLMRYAGFIGETVFDPAVSGILGFDWDEGATALEVVQTTAEDASGYAFMDGDGRLTYHNRQRRMSGPLRYTLGESTGLPYETDMSFLVDEDRVVNEVTFTRPEGADGIDRDLPSIATYGRKKKNIELHVTTDQEIMDAASAVVNSYREPVLRFEEVTFKSSAAPALFPFVLGVEVGDRVRLVDLPSQSPVSSMDFYVESVKISVTCEGATPEWVTVLSLSPASIADVWLLEDDGFGVLDDTTVLAW